MGIGLVFRNRRRIFGRKLSEQWYRHVRVRIDHVVWRLWKQGRLKDKQAISRRNALSHLFDLTTVYVSPKAVNRYVIFGDGAKRSRFFWRGDWDLDARSFIEHDRYHFMKDIWDHRDNPSQSHIYCNLLSLIEQGRPLKITRQQMIIDSPEKALAFVESKLDLFRSLAKYGVCPEMAPDEINVAIGRDGEIIKVNDGRKRMAAAKLLELEHIPVRIAHVHELWIERHKSSCQKNRIEVIKAAIRALPAKAMNPSCHEKYS